MSYNDKTYLQEAVKSVFAQKYDPLEVILSDDCSDDGSFELLQVLAQDYRGNHRVLVRQNSRRLGIARHLEECVKIAKGEIIIVAGQDDISLPDRAGEVATAFVQAGDTAKLAFSDWLEIDSTGRELEIRHAIVEKPNWARPTFPGQPPGATMAFRRELFDKFGPIRTDAVEDQILIFRAWLIGEVFRIPRVLVKYRRHAYSTSAKWEGNRLTNYKNKYEHVFACWLQRMIDYKYALKCGYKVASDPDEVLAFIRAKILEARGYQFICTGRWALIKRGFKLLPTRSDRRHLAKKLIRGIKLAFLAMLKIR